MHEFELIKHITQGWPKKDKGLLCGAGDDCAVIEGPNDKDFLITTDALFEGIHFNLEWTTPRILGRKALSVNMSDIAAMGGQPLYYLVTIGIPKGFQDIGLLFEGMGQVAAAHKMVLIGGDTCASANGLILSITAIGEVEHDRCIYRSGAKAGDAVYVTGTLGAAALGLACLKKGSRSIDVLPFINKLNNPVPRMAAARWLAASSCISAMIDVSDGLAADLGHIAQESGAGITIHADSVPLAKEFVDTSHHYHKDPVSLALTGGEDYELAFTVASEKIALFEKMFPVVESSFGHEITKIGAVIKGSGVTALDLHGANIPLVHGGFEHKF